MVKKIQKQYTGAVLNTEVTAQSLEYLKHNLISIEQFKEEFGLLLGRFKSYNAFQNSEPMPKETIAHLTKILRQVESLTENIDLIPATANAYMMEAIFKKMKFHPQAEILHNEDMQQILIEYSSVLLYALSEVKQHANLKGRKKNSALQHFIYQSYLCIKKHINISLSKSELYHVTGKLLIENGVHVPAEAENIGKIILNIKKSKNSTF